MSSWRDGVIAFASLGFGRWRRAAGVALLLAGPAWAAAADSPPPITVFDFELVNTSPMPTTPEETQRLLRLGDALRKAVDESRRYQVVATEDAVAAERNLPSLRDCNGCERDVARRLGAAYVAYGWVQKVSNLILNINLVIEDVATGRHVAAGSVDIRGNTDESWSHGLRFLLRDSIWPQ